MSFNVHAKPARKFGDSLPTIEETEALLHSTNALIEILRLDKENKKLKAENAQKGALLRRLAKVNPTANNADGICDFCEVDLRERGHKTECEWLLAQEYREKP